MTDTTVDLTWDAVTYEAGIAHYEIYRDGVLIDTSTDNVYSDTGLTAETTYVYQVKTIGSDGAESALSAELSVTTIAAV